jgi:hypothetical protein
MDFMRIYLQTVLFAIFHVLLVQVPTIIIATFVRHIEIQLILNASVTKVILKIALPPVEFATIIVKNALRRELTNVLSVNLIEK